LALCLAQHALSHVPVLKAFQIKSASALTFTSS
jgi:hypothetical protein